MHRVAGAEFRLNYRHAFHAGNFADVVKHAVLTRVLLYLQDKPSPFRVIDTHAGSGLYDLTSDEATRALSAAVAHTVAVHAAKAARDEFHCLRIELSIDRKSVAADREGLHTAGLLIVNPPWTLAGELKAILPALAGALGRTAVARFSLDPL